MPINRTLIFSLVLTVLALRADAKPKATIKTNEKPKKEKPSNYQRLDPEHYDFVTAHKGGTVIAILDTDADTNERATRAWAQQAAYDAAIPSFSCLLAGGAHLMSADDKEAMEILEDLQEESVKMMRDKGQTLPDDKEIDDVMVPPVVIALSSGKVASWTSGAHAFVGQYKGENGRQDNWTASAINEWAYASYNIMALRSTDHLENFYQNTGVPRIFVLFVDQLCGEKSRPQLMALSLWAMAQPNVVAAVGPSSFANEACGFKMPLVGGAGLCAYSGRSGKSVRMPRKLKADDEMAKWLKTTWDSPIAKAYSAPAPPPSEVLHAGPVSSPPTGDTSKSEL